MKDGILGTFSIFDQRRCPLFQPVTKINGLLVLLTIEIFQIYIFKILRIAFLYGCILHHIVSFYQCVQ